MVGPLTSFPFISFPISLNFFKKHMLFKRIKRRKETKEMKGVNNILEAGKPLKKTWHSREKHPKLGVCLFHRVSEKHRNLNCGAHRRWWYRVQLKMGDKLLSRGSSQTSKSLLHSAKTFLRQPVEIISPDKP
jgi:hypothetical protein